jgi:hypothetical protein
MTAGSRMTADEVVARLTGEAAYLSLTHGVLVMANGRRIPLVRMYDKDGDPTVHADEAVTFLLNGPDCGAPSGYVLLPCDMFDLLGTLH